MELINRELVKIRTHLPEKLAKLSVRNSQQALDLIQHWGNGTKPLREIWDLANDNLTEVIECPSK
ncbi:hypothetical protein [Sporosarcina sp. SAFN-010]|uniref:hypothetical protein n=1 Tax=Sporosarcina sp. SAFN-010 TaxID=3387273 RepID=UPI003F818CF8